MMRSFHLALLSCLVLGCTKPADPDPVPTTPAVTVQADKTSISLEGTVNASDSFNLKCNSAWTISLAPPVPTWLRLSTTSGTGNQKIILTIVEANTTGSDRTTVLGVNPASGANGGLNITVTQQASRVMGITAISPDHGPAGTMVTITGSGFNPSIAMDTVLFNGAKATVVNATSTTLAVKVPLGAGSGPVTVKTGASVMSGPPFAYELSVQATVIAGYGGMGWNNGPALQASFAMPTGLSVDSSGNIFVADLGNYTVRKITPAGIVSTFAGTTGKQGNVDGTGTAALFGYVNDIAADAAGNVFVADVNNNNIRKVTPAGEVTTFKTSVTFPTGIAVDAAGNVYTASPFVSGITRISPAGDVTRVGTSLGGGSDLYDVTLDKVGNLFACDRALHNIIKIAPSGVVTTVAGVWGVTGKTDGPGATATFNSPRSIAIDDGGNIYVADVGNNAIRKIDPSGTVSTLLDHVSSYTTDASFFGPYGVAVDKKGVLYVTNTSENKILKVTMQ